MSTHEQARLLLADWCSARGHSILAELLRANEYISTAWIFPVPDVLGLIERALQAPRIEKTVREEDAAMVERLRQGCITYSENLSNNTPGRISVDEDETNAVMLKAADRIEALSSIQPSEGLRGAS